MNPLASLAQAEFIDCRPMQLEIKNALINWDIEHTLVVSGSPSDVSHPSAGACNAPLVAPEYQHFSPHPPIEPTPALGSGGVLPVTREVTGDVSRGAVE